MDWTRNAAALAAAAAAAAVACFPGCASCDVDGGDGEGPDGAAVARAGAGERGQGAPGASEPSRAPERGEPRIILVQQHSFTRVGNDTDPEVSPLGDTLYFESTHHSELPNLYAKPIHGVEVRQLTSSGVHDFHPRVSPSGELLAFASNRSGNGDIYITAARIAGVTWQVTDTDAPEESPAWSPDGRKIVYAARNRYGVWELWIRDLETQSVTNLGPGRSPDWSPLGDRIAFQLQRPREHGWYAIWTIDVDGNNPTEVVSSGSWGAEKPCWSPDGRWIAFATVGKSTAYDAGDPRFDDIWVVRPDGSQLTQITTHPGEDRDPVWALDGRIYWSSDRGSDLETDDERNLTIWSGRPVLYEPAGGGVESPRDRAERERDRAVSEGVR